MRSLNATSVKDAETHRENERSFFAPFLSSSQPLSAVPFSTPFFSPPLSFPRAPRLESALFDRRGGRRRDPRCFTTSVLSSSSKVARGGGTLNSNFHFFSPLHRHFCAAHPRRLKKRGAKKKVQENTQRQNKKKKNTLHAPSHRCFFLFSTLSLLCSPRGKMKSPTENLERGKREREREDRCD